MGEKKLLGMKETMQLTGLSRKKILFYIREGLLPFVNVSEGNLLARYKFHTQTIEEFLKKIQVTI